MELPNCKNCTNSQCPNPTLQSPEIYDKCTNDDDIANYPENKINTTDQCTPSYNKTTPSHSECINHTPKHTPIYKPTPHSKCEVPITTQNPNCAKPTTNPLKCILPKFTEKKSSLCNLPFNIKQIKTYIVNKY